MKYVYVIMVDFIVDGKVDSSYISGEGYSTPQQAQEFLIKERNCNLYESFASFPYKLDKDGWCGLPKDDKAHRYYIKEILIK